MEEVHTPSVDILSSIPPEDKSIHKPPKKKYILLSVIITVLILAIGVSGFVLGAHRSSTMVAKPTVVLTPAINSTGGWLSYTDPNKRFSFQYPKDWQTVVISASNDVVVTTPEIAAEIKSRLNGDGACFPFYPILIEDISGQDEREAFENTYYQTVTQTPIVVDGLSAIEYDVKMDFSSCGFNTGQDISVILSKGDKTYRIDLVNSDNPTYKKVFDELLPTLKFEKVSTNIPIPSPTKVPQTTYIDKDYGYKISYPVT